MRCLATLAVVAALMSATAASGQDYSFGDWARDQGYSPGDVMPDEVEASSSIDSLDGIGEFDWTTTPTETLWLGGNRISSIESGDFSGLTGLTNLSLYGNQLSRIESGAFSGLTNLTMLGLGNNSALTDLNLEAADFSSLVRLHLERNVNITSVSLRNTVLNQTALVALMSGVPVSVGIGELGATITNMDLSGIDFADITDLAPLYVMDDLTDLWLVDTHSLDAIDLDLLLDNLATIEGTGAEGILHMTEANFGAFNAAGGGRLETWDAEPGHRVAFVGAPAPLLGDLNLDGEVNGLDIDPFVDVLLNGPYQPEADMNEDRRINGLDVDSFVVAVGGGSTQPVPEPSTLLLTLVALGVVGGWRKWRG